MMSAIWSFIYGKLTDPLDLPLVLWQQWLILAVIGVIAYIIAYYAVRDMYNNSIFKSGFMGSLAHWLIRLAVFVFVWAITYGVIAAGKFIYSHRVQSLVSAGILAVVGLVAWIVHRKKTHPFRF